MADSMRGSRLGYTSYEIDPGFNAPTKITTYVCPAEHAFSLPFSIDADEIPDTWVCDCGESAIRQTEVKQGLKPAVKKEIKPAKTHLDMLMERRTKKDLEQLLKERVAGIRKPKQAS